MITKVEKGYINTDFMEDRITLKAYQEDGDVIPCKLYGNGRLVNFWGDGSDEYTERLLSDEIADEIRAKL